MAENLAASAFIRGLEGSPGVGKARRQVAGAAPRQPAISNPNRLVGSENVAGDFAGSNWSGPVLSALAGDVPGQFQPAPDAESVERAAQWFLISCSVVPTIFPIS
jgi:hypothetical protein